MSRRANERQGEPDTADMVADLLAAARSSGETPGHLKTRKQQTRHPDVPAATCARWRRELRGGASLGKIAKHHLSHYSKRTIGRHARGECAHDREPPVAWDEDAAAWVARKGAEPGGEGGGT